MKAYLVRVEETKEAVGFFATESLDDLVELVDECCEPRICECREIEQGGIFWPGHEPAIPLEDPEHQHLSDNFSFTDSWSLIEDGHWFRFTR